MEQVRHPAFKVDGIDDNTPNWVMIVCNKKVFVVVKDAKEQAWPWMGDIEGKCPRRPRHPPGVLQGTVNEHLRLERTDPSSFSSKLQNIHHIRSRQHELIQHDSSFSIIVDQRQQANTNLHNWLQFPLYWTYQCIPQNSGPLQFRWKETNA